MYNGRQRVKVFDAAGNEMLVTMVDAREIIAAGGSYDGVIAEKKAPEAKPHPAEAKVEEAEVKAEEEAAEKPKRGRKPKDS